MRWRENMTRQLKYDRPKLVDLTSKEWNVEFGHGTEQLGACTNGIKPDYPTCSMGRGVGG
jgi:hypothetical protein